METKLYQFLKKEFDEKSIDFSLENIQKSIEETIITRNNSLKLNENYIKKIINYLKIYNKFLISIGKKEIKLRYYQILALYFTEKYFDIKNEKEFDDEAFSKNALAYWMATGSGKTIIMHLNILQYLDKIKNYKTFQIILTTPGVNLIEQHKKEIEPFINYLNNKKYNNKLELIIDTTSSLLNKGADYYSLAGNKRFKRLILVDEAHIGISSTDEGKFYNFRNKLNKENSFLFEYSATYHNLSRNLEEEYKNQIIYDYNYNLFYKDGYGKDFSFYQIGNDILAGENENELKQNLDKCLNIINEKIKIWSEIKDYDDNKQIALFGDIKMFPDKPLIAFMGNTVNNKNNEKNEVSDIVNIIKYLALLTEKEKKEFEMVFNHKINGKLTITRIKSIKDELLLSFGDSGKYFGIINVGSGNKFFNNIDLENVDKKTIEIIDEKYLFKNIDGKKTPINILIGSRKFAEGWNSFRVSEIVLINLGTNAGNKIIQIFGRGVRLKGLNGDGKRKYKEHTKDYFELGNSWEDKIKKLETLNVLSVKKSYLETFTKKIREEVKYIYSFSIKVNPNIIKLTDQKELKFEEYRNNLPIFKLSKKEINYKNIILDGENIYYSYFDNKKIINNEKISNFNFSLDYRINRKKEAYDIKNELKEKLEKFKNYLDTNYINKFIKDYLQENKVNLYIKKEEIVKDFSYNIVFGYINEIIYDNNFGNDINKLEKTIIIILRDFLSKLKNKVNHRINSKNIIYNEKLSQKTKENKTGNFIEEYLITKEFKTEKEKNKYIENLKQEKEKIVNLLKIDFSKHIYFPLLKEDTENLGIKISPDKLNLGEKIFIEELKKYIDENYKNSKLEFYVMRNVESLKSIGIYLENDEHPFFPDFIMWIIDKEKDVIYINFIDPKGQDGIFDRNTGNFNDKAKIGNKKEDNTLIEIETKIKEKTSKEIILNSFILLKLGSDLGKTNNDNIQEKMILNNIFKIDWHGENKLNGKSYLDLLFGKIIK